MSQTMRCRPSSLLGVTGGWEAFCTDRAVWTFAKTVEAEMDLAEKRLPKNAKDTTRERTRQKVLDQYLGQDPADTPNRFRSVG